MCCWKKLKQPCWKDFGPSSQASWQILIGGSTLLTLLENKCSPTNSWFKQPMYHGKKSHQFITSFNNFKIYTPQKSNIDTKYGPYLKGITFFKSFFLGIQPFVFRGVYVWINFMGIFTNLTCSKLWASMVATKTKLCRWCWVSEKNYTPWSLINMSPKKWKKMECEILVSTGKLRNGNYCPLKCHLKRKGSYSNHPLSGAMLNFRCFKSLSGLQLNFSGGWDGPNLLMFLLAILGFIYLNMVVQLLDFGCINGKQCQNHGFSVRYWVSSWLSFFKVPPSWTFTDRQ